MSHLAPIALAMAVLDGPNTWSPATNPTTATTTVRASASATPRVDLVAKMRARVEAQGQTPVEPQEPGRRGSLADRMSEMVAAQQRPEPQARTPGAGLGGEPPPPPPPPPRTNLAERMRERFRVKDD